MATIEITMQNFEDTIESHEMVLLDFWAEWCQPCKMLAPVFEEMAKHNPDILFGKVNTEACVDLAQAFQVRSIPTLMAFKKGELVFEQAGLLTPPQLTQLLDGLRKAVPQPPAKEEEPF
jgi:thioredoxin